MTVVKKPILEIGT